MFASVVSGWKWFMASPIAQGVAALIAAFIGYKTWKWNVERGVLRQAREEFARRSAEREAEIVNTITENSNELVRESERVRAHPSVVELPDGTEGLPEYHYRREDNNPR